MNVKKLAAALTAAGIAAVSVCTPAHAQDDAGNKSFGIISGFDTGAVRYSDEYFAESSFKYSYDLAVFSAYLSASEYLIGGDGRLSHDILRQSGFDEITDWGSFEKAAGAGDESDLAEYTFAHKKVTRGSGSFDLISVTLNGTGNSAAGWSSNFNVGTETRHKGFNTACRELEKDLNDYASGLGIDFDSAGVLICGHSRGAAVTNLLAADITNAAYGSGETGLLDVEVFGRLAPENIYAYAFAPPAVEISDGITVDIRDESSKYANICNIIDPNDFVPQMPLAGWGYSRYGKQFVLPSGLTAGSVGNDIYVEAMDGEYAEMGFGSYSGQVGKLTDSYGLSTFRELAEDIKDPKEYYEKNVSLVGNVVTPYSFFHDGIVGIFTSDSMDAYKETLKIIAGGTVSAVFIRFVTYLTKGMWDGSLICAHAPQKYIAGTTLMKTVDDYVSGDYSRVCVSAGYDITVKDEEGETVAYVSGASRESITVGLYRGSDGIDIYLPLGEEFTIEVSGKTGKVPDITLYRENTATGRTAYSRDAEIPEMAGEIVTVRIDENGSFTPAEIVTAAQTEAVPETQSVPDEVTPETSVTAVSSETTAGTEPPDLSFGEPDEYADTTIPTEDDCNPSTGAGIPLAASVLSLGAAVIAKKLRYNTDTPR